MTLFHKLKKSKIAWKIKAVRRASELRELRKKLNRFKLYSDKRRQELEQEVHLLKSENASLKTAAQTNKLPVMSAASFVELRTLCILLVISGIVSFRSVPRILRVCQLFGASHVQIPHFTSVIHWVLRSGVAIFSQVSTIHGPWIAILDCSIDIGTRKALVVLRVSLAALENRKGAICLQDCECIGLKISSTWNGTLVSDALKEVFNISGQPIAILKDGGTDLNKGVQLYRESESAKQIMILDDVGHVTANALKAEFAEQTSFVKFLNIIRKGAARIRQTDLAWLLPPKIRTKGRFQGITEVADWATKILSTMGGQGRAQENSELSRLRKAFSGLPKLRDFLSRFCGACETTELFLKIIKQTGLNQETYKAAKNIILQLPEKSITQVRLLSWLDKHLYIQCKMGIGQTPLLTSSDVLESLFGKFKTVVQRNPQAELNRLVYVIPLLCGSRSKEQIASAVKSCSHNQMLNEIEKTIPQTLRQQRHRVLERGRPETGNLNLKKTG